MTEAPATAPSTGSQPREASRAKERNIPMDRAAPTNPAAVVSLVFGILTWVVLPLVGALVAIVAGHMAVNQLQQPHSVERGRKLAVVGLALGWLQILVVLAGFAGWLVLLLIGGALGALAWLTVALLVIGALGALAMLVSLLFSGFS
jgi:hypothetical protein